MGSTSEEVEGKIDRIENYLMKWKTDFEALKNYLESYSTIRFEESKTEHQLHDLMTERPEFANAQSSLYFNAFADLNKKHQEVWFSELNNLDEFADEYQNKACTRTKPFNCN